MTQVTKLPNLVIVIPSEARNLLFLVVLSLSVIWLTGCTSIQSLFGIAQSAGAAAAAALQATDPTTASQIDQVVSGLGAVSGLITSYDSASASAQPGIAGKIEAASSALQTNLASLLNAFKIKHPELVTTIEVFVAAGNAALVAAVNHIPASSTTQAVTASAATATSSVKVASMNTAAAVKKAWNAKAQVNLPAAVLK